MDDVISSSREQPPKEEQPEVIVEKQTAVEKVKPLCDLDFLELLTLIFVIGKVFGFLDDWSWWAVFSPLWAPFMLFAWLIVYAWNWAVGFALAIAIAILIAL